MKPLESALIALFAPLVAALILALCVPLRRRGRAAAWLSLAAGVTSLASTALLITGFLTHPEKLVRTVPWLLSSGVPLVEVGIRVDGISVSMLGVVGLVAVCVQLFSIGYLSSEPAPSLGRYFAYQSLFLFSMNLLVLAPNLLQLFVGWELVGTTSYLLIGYSYQKPSAARAAVKAFWVTKFSDMGLLTALIVLCASTGSMSWDTTLPTTLATAIAGLMFLSVMGKSAQFPLHVWLPDAMEGPTPVSALLHAATMVAAGVYLLVRADPLFDQAPAVRLVMLHVGAFTAVFAALIALVQTDIKRVLAYSTCSQLGYMIAALGAGSLMGGYFHLTTHAFFKALLFLSAGSFIHAVHSNQLADMGGLGRRMRLTSVTFAVGAFALAGVPGFSGFFSKDSILEQVVAARLWPAAAALFLAVFLTALYMGKTLTLALLGAPSDRASRARESGPTLWLPLVALAVPSVVAGYFAASLATLWGERYAWHLSSVGAAASLTAVLGLAGGWLVYGERRALAGLRERLAPLARWILGGAVDRAYVALYRFVLLRSAALVAWVDRYVIDGAMNAFATLFIVSGQRLRRIQTGYAQDYVFAVMAGAVALAIWGISQ
ncbi:MAG TPA: NADH-quinone oxidoreductase subunit L [Polyangiaceae bacterium]